MSRLSDSHIVAESARFRDRLACCWPARSNLADMTGQRGPRHTVASPARMIMTAPSDGHRAPGRADYDRMAR